MPRLIGDVIYQIKAAAGVALSLSRSAVEGGGLRTSVSMVVVNTGWWAAPRGQVKVSGVGGEDGGDG